jgi:hypothetical protein
MDLCACGNCRENRIDEKMFEMGRASQSGNENWCARTMRLKEKVSTESADDGKRFGVFLDRGEILFKLGSAVGGELGELNAISYPWPTPHSCRRW